MSNVIRKQFFFQIDKKEFLIDYLTKYVWDYQNYHLVLVSCYFKLDSAKDLIDSLRNRKIRIKRVYIYIDRGSAIDIGKYDILKWIIKNSIELKLDIKFKISKTSNLFHAKAYCLLSEDYKNGSLVLGSANLTNKGLIGTSGNIELLYETYNIDHILAFCKDLESSNALEFIDVSQLEEFDKENDYYFKFALLQEGYFVKPIESNKNLLSFKYIFNEKGQREYKTKEYNELGFEDKNNHSANYFKDIESVIKKICLKYNPGYHIDWGKYGIKTDFGYWIPKHIVSYLNKNYGSTSKDIELCKIEIRKELEKHLPSAKDEMQKQWNDLLIKDWLTDEFKPSLTLEKAENILKEKINLFINNLDEYLLRYYIVEIQFDFVNLDWIQYLFNTLEQACIKKIGERYYGREFDMGLDEESISPYHLQTEAFHNDLNLGLREVKDAEYLVYRYIDNDSNMLFKCLALAIRNQQLRFIRWLSLDFFINHASKKTIKKY